ncbi:hypothetical protein HAX54_025670 [Datura stramonium]|uniref:Uncharacterized protein n=1 Tax=Datura stramonium TaxID=4076 RepID=A0ABS8V118_DATST|nr:hypothetical protein [Datura stramonium]
MEGITKKNKKKDTISEFPSSDRVFNRSKEESFLEKIIAASETHTNLRPKVLPSRECPGIPSFLSSRRFPESCPNKGIKAPMTAEEREGLYPHTSIQGYLCVQVFLSYYRKALAIANNRLSEMESQLSLWFEELRTSAEEREKAIERAGKAEQEASQLLARLKESDA